LDKNADRAHGLAYGKSSKIHARLSKSEQIPTSNKWDPRNKNQPPYTRGPQKKVFMPTHQSTVLLVEDDGDLRVAISALLAQTGYRVRTAWDGLSALLEMETGLPDIIVSDLQMPRMSGFELLSTIRLQFPAIPLIAMSGVYSSNQIPEGVVADAFYQKGTHPTFLVNLVGSMTQLSSHCPLVD
jgi:CheY-like chemotaxis protein